MDFEFGRKIETLSTIATVPRGVLTHYSAGKYLLSLVLYDIMSPSRLGHRGLRRRVLSLPRVPFDFICFVATRGVCAGLVLATPRHGFDPWPKA